jgi:hypothetical protein
MFYSTARSIDNQATATTFRAAYVRYAGETEAWFDGTPQSIDGRIARANRLLHLAKESVARQGMDAEKLASIGELQADVKALTALRHDLLTAGADREDTSPIAGVHIAAGSYGDWGGKTNDDGNPVGWDIYNELADEDEDDDEESQEWGKVLKRGPGGKDLEERLKRDRKANCGDDEEYKGGEDDEDGGMGWTSEERNLDPAVRDRVLRRVLQSEQPNDYLFDEQGRYRRERFKGKEAGYFGDGQDNDWRDEGYYDDEDKRDKRGKHRMDEVGGSGRPVTNPYTGDDGGSFSGNPKGRGHWDKAGGLSPDDRRFVVLESARFLADNTDTDDVRELATRAQHFAQQVTSTYSDDRSQAVTTAFVRRVASAAAQRRDAVRREPSGMSRQASTVNALPPEALFL